MNYDVFTPNFPIFEGKTLRLRAVRETDVPVLFQLLQSQDVIDNYCVEGGFETLERVHHNYVTSARVTYQNRQQIQWLLEEKTTGTVVGVRDLFVDNETKPLTVQGFIGSAYRRRGYSKEAYQLILNYAKQCGAVGLMANTGVENYAAVAQLFSVGFKPLYVAYAPNDLRLVFINDYSFEDNYAFANANLKRLYIFCKMYLNATSINISEGLPIKYDGALHHAYSVKLVAKNTIGNRLQDIHFANLSFASDGVIIMANDDSVDGISFLDGRTEYFNSWAFCWQECQIG